MPDIATAWMGSLDSKGDWALDGPDLASCAPIDSAVLISLFTDARADADDVIPDGSTDRRGWWADGDPEGPIGSKIWLRIRSKATPDLLNIVRDDIVRALQWLMDDAVCSRIDVSTQWIFSGLLGAIIVLYRDGQPPRRLAFGFAWNDGPSSFSRASNAILIGEGF